jgi:LIM domain kinase 1
MNKKNLLERLVEVFTSNEVIETSFIDVKTTDGRILRVAEMAVDKGVKEITADGEIDLKDGEYQLEDETIIKVEGGLIIEISTKEEEVEEPVVEEQMEEVVAEEVVEEPVVEDTTEVDTLIENIKSLIDEVAELKTGFTSLVEENKELKLEIEKFSKAPSAEPTKVKVDFSIEKNKSESIMYNILTKNKK